MSNGSEFDAVDCWGQLVAKRITYFLRLSLTTDYRHPMKPLFIEIPNFWAWADRLWVDKFWGILDNIGLFISTHLGTVSPLSTFFINQQLFLQKTKPLYPLSKSQIFIWDWDLNLGLKELSIWPLCVHSPPYYEISEIFQLYPYSYWQFHLTNYAILIPKWCKYPILGCKTSKVDIRRYFITYEKMARLGHCWIFLHLSLKTKISFLVVRYQESNGCQKNQQDPEIWSFLCYYSDNLKKTMKFHLKSVIFDGF